MNKLRENWWRESRSIGRTSTKAWKLARVWEIQRLEKRLVGLDDRE